MDWFWIIYLFLVVGAAGLYLLMAQPGKPSLKLAGVLAGLASVAGVIVSLPASAGWQGGGNMIWFCLLGGTAVLTAALMIVQVRPVYSALFFVMTLIAVAAMVLQQQAAFLAFAIVIVYAGAILVVYVFVLMLTRHDRLPWYDSRFHMPFGAVLTGFIIIGALLRMVLALPDTSGEVVVADYGSPVAIGRELYNNHFVALQVAGLILLIAAVGASVLVRTRHTLVENDEQTKKETSTT